MTPKQLRDAGELGEAGTVMGSSPGTCPSCGNTMTDMRGKAFAVSQSAAAGMCVYLGGEDYTCCVEERKRRRSRFNYWLRKPHPL